MEISKDIKAEMTLISTEHGGRKSCLPPEIRPQFYYKNKSWDVKLVFIDVQQICPGETAKVYFTFLTPQNHIGNLKVNDHFLLREGQKVIAYGHVIELIDLERSTN